MKEEISGKFRGLLHCITTLIRGQADQCSVCSNADSAPVHSGKEIAKLKGKTHYLQLDPISYFMVMSLGVRVLYALGFFCVSVLLSVHFGVWQTFSSLVKEENLWFIKNYGQIE